MRNQNIHFGESGVLENEPTAPGFVSEISHFALSQEITVKFMWKPSVAPDFTLDFTVGHIRPRRGMTRGRVALCAGGNTGPSRAGARYGCSAFSPPQALSVCRV